MSKSVERHLLSDAGLDVSALEKALAHIHRHDTDYADLYFQYSKNEFWSIEDGKVNNGSFSIEQGVGLRSIVGEKTAFTYSDEISLAALENGIKTIKSMHSQGESATFPMQASSLKKSLYTSSNPIDSLNVEKKN